MSDLLLKSIGVTLEAASSVLARQSRWPDLGAALARLLLVDAARPFPHDLGLPPDGLGPDLIRRSPELAGMGYALSNIQAIQTHELWFAGFERLMRREVYPLDRDSFVQEPLELIGLALGLRACRLVDDTHRRWFSDQLQRGLADQRIASGLARACAQFASFTAGGSALSESPVIDIAVFPHEDLSTLFGLTRLAPGWLDQLVIPIEQALNRAALEQGSDLMTPLQAATAQILLQEAMDRFISQSVAGNPLDMVVQVCRRLPLLIAQIQKRSHGKPDFEVADEYDVQDLLHGVLRLHFADVRPEEYTPSQAGKSSRIDFLLPRDRIIVEAKMPRPSLKGKDVADQLLIDKHRYKAMPGVDSLVCIVYDPGGFCPNPAGLEQDLSSDDPELKVAVIITPQGI